ncbi:MAG: DNA integrity scanning diadenylate cyclase DisA [Propionibacteriaceae bacterium]|uniref:DNA integrity scanning diadenylate cyclase DisA n=1 Tax=Brooklawnia propionicigenes TaxID=3041175 RepID=A0AAN0MG37_9ACTN|nr:DNA integrity scanning diadenylate cyclase DisA [Brooklawnia sp. SH051]MCB0883564.1 DNA integrity scanning diadenylate cyclase DisA [Propionibacteriaceae bacterium]MEA5120584.1 DNA integrity scanning diadenylate cyclase DisA [Propionibacterium sp.]NLI86351.1 DNA integrity scanning protein DisA [Propionibacterium sp.]BEH01556.1 DNA integrity scanning diadenylate cyclase DisA [Brooklawnia sp. SH051]
MSKDLGHDEERYRRYRALLAPGTPLREGLERIRAGHTGALIVLGTNPVVEQVSTGGFTVNTDFTPTALRELAKMDGGIVVDDDLTTIISAGVHFSPSASLPTVETGTRHRTADRVALQSNVPVVTVSAAMSVIALFMAGLRYPIESSEQILVRAEQAVATLSRYRERLDSVTRELSGLEMDDLVTVGDLVQAVQPLAMVRRLAEELEGHVEALGVDGRLLQLQMYELTQGIDQLATLLELDYRDAGAERFTLDVLRHLPTGDLLDPVTVASAIGLTSADLDTHLRAHGYRIVSQSAQMSTTTAGRLLEHFGSLQAVFAASGSELAAVPGVGTARARAIRDGLARISDSVSSR